MYITLKEIKHHLNLQDFDEDDSLLLTYIQASEGTIEAHINQPLQKVAEENNGELPHQVKVAILMLTGSMYQNRESTSVVNLTNNPVYSYLLGSVMNYASSPHNHKHLH